MSEQNTAADTLLCGRPDRHRDISVGRTPLRLLTFTTLFPNGEQPNHGIFVENRLRHLIASGEATSVVVAPVPYFPSLAPYFGAGSLYARIAARQVRHGIIILHSRFPGIPRIGMTESLALLAAGVL